MAARSTIQAGGFGWSGPLEDTSVAEVLERCAALRLSGLVELSDGGRTAMVNLVGGQVASSPSDTLENLRAWTQGRFRVIQCVPDLAGNLSGGIRLAGSLEEAAPAQLIRHLEVTALTADLELKGPRDEAARVRIAFGQIESIEVAGDRSPAAMRRLDGWRRGSFSIALRPLFAEDAPPPPPLPPPLISAVKTEAMAAAAAPMEPPAVPGRGRETEVMAPLAAPPANPSRGRETEVMAPLAAPPANPSRGRGTEVMAPLAAPPANPHRPPRPVAPSSSPSAASAGRRTAPSASVAGGGKGWLVVIAIGVGALLVAVALLVLLLRHEAPPSSPPTPPKAAAPTVAPLPPEAAAKLDEARHHLLEGRKQKAVAAVAAAMVLAPDDPQVLRLRDMVEGTAGQGELVYGGHGAVVVDGVRFKGPRRIKVAAGPHRLGEGSEAVEIVVEAGGAHDVTGAE